MEDFTFISWDKNVFRMSTRTEGDDMSRLIMTEQDAVKQRYQQLGMETKLKFVSDG